MYTMAEEQMDTVLGLDVEAVENKGEKMNCTQQYVSKVLKGRENLSLETLCKIENALGIRILQAGIK